MTTRFTYDWSTGLTAWDAAYWSTTVTGTSASIDEFSGEGRIVLPNGSARYVYGIDTVAATANQEVLVKVRSDSATRNNALFIGVAMSGLTTRPATPTDGVYFRAPGTTATGAQIVHYHGGVGTDAGVTPTNNFAGTSTFWVRLQHVNGIVKLRQWIDGSAEPSTWDHTVDITGFAALPAGHVVLGAETTSSTTAAESIFFDNLTSTDAAAASVAGGYTATPMTASGLMVNPVVTAVKPDVTYAATPMTASGLMPSGSKVSLDKTVAATALTANAVFNNPTVTTENIQRIAVADDAYTDTASQFTNFNNSSLWVNSARTSYFKFPAPTLTGSQSVVGARLVLTPTGSAITATVSVDRVTGAWTETGITAGSAPAKTAVRNVNLSSNGVTPVSVDVTDVYNSTNTGVALSYVSGTASNFSSGEVAGSNAATIEYVIGESVVVSVPATPLTASLAMPDPVISTTSSVSASGQPMTATATTVNPVVVAEQHIDVTLTAEPMWAQSEMPGGGFSSPVSTAAGVMSADAIITDATVATERGVLIAETPATATISWVQPAAVNGAAIILNESEDGYFQRVNALAPESWWRLDDKTSTVTDRIGGDANGSYVSVLFGQHDGPEDRASAHFDGTGYIKGGTVESAPAKAPQSVPLTTLEFSFRTTRANSYLMYSADDVVVSNGSTNVSVDAPGREIYLTNGRLTYQTDAFSGPSSSFTGRTNLADGQWHHVVIKGFSGFDGQGTEIWIDGKFEVRRYNAGSWNGMPDYVGGLPGQPTSSYLVGDVSEIAFYEKILSSDDVSRNYYAFMGWSPISVEPAIATAAMGDAKAKGNQKKALYLYWDYRSEVFKDSDGVSEQFGPDDIDFDPMPDFVSASNRLPIGDFHGYKVFAKPVTNDGMGGAYRDPYTDEQSLINLETDVDLSQYDVIMFKDWPDESAPQNANQIELDFVERTYPGQKERLLNQLRDANDAGIGLYVTNPRLAVDLGIIDKVEYVPTLKESASNSGQGGAAGLYDYGSAVNFPWNIAASDGLTGGQYATGIGAAEDMSSNYLTNKAFFYNDTHKNNRFRVRALVDGLTDIPSYMIEDAVFHVDYDPYGWQGVAYKYLNAEDGLQIGDEYIYYGTEIVNSRYEEKVDYRYMRYFGTWATPMADVKAGTVVTTFGAKHWNGKTEVDNPYKDYATTIVLNPGDNLAGRPVGGKIFVNFTEAPSKGLGLPVQVLPAADNNVAWPFLYPHETDAQRDWDYSWTRTTLNSTTQNTQTSVTITLPTGETTVIPLGGTADNLSMVRSSQLFPVIGKPRWEMDGRGMFWLSVKPEVGAGDKTVRVTPMAANASMPTPAVVAQRDVTVNVEAISATATMPKVKEDQTGDVDILALPMRASATFTGYGKTITVEPMTATAELVETFDMVHATGEQVVLTLHGYDVTLFIKEES